ncbi:transporter [Rubritalea tangerina]
MASISISNLQAQDFSESLASGAASADSGGQVDELAKKLANPIADLVSFPIQANYDENYGADDGGSVWRINVQPVIPIQINEDWNVISRTIVPVIDQSGFSDPNQNKSGIGDTVQSLFFSPREKVGDWILGGGPVFLLPTASNDVLGSERWGIGPTGIALKQFGPWTVGGLANHIWSFAGNEDRNTVNATFLQPFINYILPSKTTLYLNSESTYDWNSSTWSAPINFGANQMLKIAGQPLQVGIGGRYWLDSPRNGPEGWGLRINFIMLFPK